MTVDDVVRRAIIHGDADHGDGYHISVMLESGLVYTGGVYDPGASDVVRIELTTSRLKHVFIKRDAIIAAWVEPT